MAFVGIGVLLILVTLAAITDVKSLKIPNELTAAGFILAIILQSFGALKEDWLTLLIDFLIFFIPLMLMWIIGTLTSFQALAAGDVKLLSVMAMYLNPTLLLMIVVVAMILVSLANLRKISFSFYRDIPRELYYFLFFGIPGKSKERKQNVPFGPFLALATFGFIVKIYFF